MKNNKKIHAPRIDDVVLSTRNDVTIIFVMIVPRYWCSLLYYNCFRHAIVIAYYYSLRAGPRAAELHARVRSSRHRTTRTLRESRRLSDGDRSYFTYLPTIIQPPIVAPHPTIPRGFSIGVPCHRSRIPYLSRRHRNRARATYTLPCYHHAATHCGSDRKSYAFCSSRLHICP